jgi:hypothetical protein
MSTREDTTGNPCVDIENNPENLEKCLENNPCVNECMEKSAKTLVNAVRENKDEYTDFFFGPIRFLFNFMLVSYYALACARNCIKEQYKEKSGV